MGGALRGGKIAGPNLFASPLKIDGNNYPIMTCGISYESLSNFKVNDENTGKTASKPENCV